jgi:hypothetical protein
MNIKLLAILEKNVTDIFKMLQMMGWMAEEFGLDSWQGQRFFSSPRPPDQLRGPPSLLFSGYWGLFPQQ